MLDICTMFTTAHVVVVTLLLGHVHSAVFGHATHVTLAWVRTSCTILMLTHLLSK